MAADQPSDLPVLIFTEGVTSRRDSMLRRLLGEGYPREKIVGELDALRWRALQVQGSEDPPTPTEQAEFGTDVRVVNDQVLRWRLRAILAGDKRSLFVTAIEDAGS